MKPKAHYINVTTFRSFVLLVVGKDVEECVKALSAHLDLTEADFAGYAKHMEEERDGLLANGDSSARFCRCGRCITHGSEALLWFPTFPTAATLAHECLHAVQNMLKDRGVADANGETDAYLFEEVFRHFLTVLAEDAKKEFGRRTEVEP